MQTLIYSCEYSFFEQVRDWIYQNGPACILHAGYSKDLYKAVFSVKNGYSKLIIDQFKEKHLPIELINSPTIENKDLI